MDYANTLEEAKARLEQLAADRSVIDREIEALLRIIEGATALASPTQPETEAGRIPKLADSDGEGFTGKVRLILRRSKVPLVSTEVRDALEIMGVEASSPKILLIQVHNTLRRLFEGGEIEQVPRDGKMAFRMLTIGDLMFRELCDSPIVSFLRAVPSTQMRSKLKEIKKSKEPKQ